MFLEETLNVHPEQQIQTEIYKTPDATKKDNISLFQKHGAAGMDKT